MESKSQLTPRMIPKPPAHVATIIDDAALAETLARLRRRDWVAIDTEFHRERTYYPQLCLVQIADVDEIALIDVLAVRDLAPLTALLADPTVIKVFHSAEQDLEVLYQTLDVMPAPLFDTQLAAPLIGLDDQMGYARMIEALLGVKLSKAYTRTAWHERPLPDGALAYAADDVRYLAVAYRTIVARLEAMDRHAWARADADRLPDPARFAPVIDQAWRRVKGWLHLSPAGQQVLAELAAWRERQAMASDRPRRWILSDALMRDLAESAPADEIALADTPDLPDKTRQRHGAALLDAIARGRARTPAVLDPDAGPPDAATRRRIKRGMQALDEIAAAHGIPTATLGSRAEVARMVAGRRDVRVLTGWRGELAGTALPAAITAPDDTD